MWRQAAPLPPQPNPFDYMWRQAAPLPPQPNPFDYMWRQAATLPPELNPFDYMWRQAAPLPPELNPFDYVWRQAAPLPQQPNPFDYKWEIPPEIYKNQVNSPPAPIQPSNPWSQAPNMTNRPSNPGDRNSTIHGPYFLLIASLFILVLMCVICLPLSSDTSFHLWTALVNTAVSQNASI